jgi:hypothetical protein
MRTWLALSAATVLLPVYIGSIGCGEVAMDAVELPPEIFSDGLVARWRLDEGQGILAKDDSGNGHNGQLVGGTWISDARFGNGLRFAAGDGVMVSAFPSATSDWSVSLWVRLSEDQLAADGETWTTILSNENAGSGGWEVNLDRQLAKPRFVFSYWAPPLGNYIGTECSCVETGAWIHLAAVVDVRTDLITLYHDGKVADQAVRPSDIPPGDSTLHFGRWNMSGRLLNGDLDEVAVWQRTLAAGEVAALSTRPP